MIDKLISDLEKKGKLKKQKAGIVQVEALLRESILDLEEAKRITEIAERATYMLAYVAMLKAGRALLLFKGYIPSDGAQHKTVVEITSVILGEKFKDLTRQFETMRRKRNELTYEAGTLLSKGESKRAFTDAIALLQEILREVKSQNPQLELKIEI
ncbi:MAG: hypothetical protein A2297_02000 [Elusimicrobia bacterium RIFOXYB2_FULL_48_7]|nr:MAG: hypothetical protein A2297_02000 [Elusimicrobia bacterium RIFOXYB2_FULL_48_7]